MKKYKFRKYDERFPELYKKEKTKLKKSLPTNAKIEHIGSTAIKELGGKGIIDILIAVPKEQIDRIKDKLIKNKYEFKIKGGDENRLFFERDYKYLGKVRRVHLHLTFVNSLVWRKSLAVRDYLIKNNKESKEYAEIKKRAVKICKGEGKIYREYKKSFLDKIEKEALK